MKDMTLMSIQNLWNNRVMKIQRLNRNKLQINTKGHINNIVLEKENNIKS